MKVRTAVAKVVDAQNKTEVPALDAREIRIEGRTWGVGLRTRCTKGSRADEPKCSKEGYV